MPAVVDLACMRDAMNKLGGDSNKINPLVRLVLVYIGAFGLFFMHWLCVMILKLVSFRYPWILSLITLSRLM